MSKYCHNCNNFQDHGSFCAGCGHNLGKLPGSYGKIKMPYNQNHYPTSTNYSTGPSMSTIIPNVTNRGPYVQPQIAFGQIPPIYTQLNPFGPVPRICVQILPNGQIIQSAHMF